MHEGSGFNTAGDGYGAHDGFNTAGGGYGAPMREGGGAQFKGAASMHKAPFKGAASMHKASSMGEGSGYSGGGAPPNRYPSPSEWSKEERETYRLVKGNPILQKTIRIFLGGGMMRYMKPCRNTEPHPSLNESPDGCLYCGYRVAVPAAAHPSADGHAEAAPARAAEGGHAGIEGDHKAEAAEAAVDALVGGVEKAHLG